MAKAGRILDMTHGSAMGKMFAFAAPMLIGNVFQQLYSIADTMVAGYCLGDSAIAAIGSTTSLYLLLINLACGLNGGFALAVTRAFGSHDQERLKRSIAAMILLDAAITAALTVLALCFLKLLMQWMNTPETIFPQAYRYMAVIAAGMTATVAYNLFAGILRAFGNSRTPLYFLILTSLVNIALDLLFVSVFHMGVAVAALATVAAQGISAVLTGLFLFRRYRGSMPDRHHFRPDAKTLRGMFASGAAMAVMYSMIDLGSILFQSAANALGTAAIAAYTAARRIIAVGMQPLMTMADAAGTFAAQNHGAGQKQRIREGVWKVLGIQALWSALACAAVFLFGSSIIRLTTGTADAAVLTNAILSLRIHFPFFPLLGAVLTLRIVMQSLGETKMPVISSLIELAIKILSVLWIIPAFGFAGVCATEPAAWLIMSLFLLTVVKVRKLLS